MVGNHWIQGIGTEDFCPLRFLTFRYSWSRYMSGTGAFRDWKGQDVALERLAFIPRELLLRATMLCQSLKFSRFGFGDFQIEGDWRPCWNSTSFKTGFPATAIADPAKFSLEIDPDDAALCKNEFTFRYIFRLFFCGFSLFQFFVFWSSQFQTMTKACSIL